MQSGITTELKIKFREVHETKIYEHYFKRDITANPGNYQKYKLPKNPYIFTTKADFD